MTFDHLPSTISSFFWTLGDNIFKHFLGIGWHLPILGTGLGQGEPLHRWTLLLHSPGHDDDDDDDDDDNDDDDFRWNCISSTNPCK